MNRIALCIVIVFIVSLDGIVLAKANIPFEFNTNLVRFEPLKQVDFPDIADSSPEIRSHSHVWVLPLTLSRSAKWAAAKQLNLLLRNDGLARLMAEMRYRDQAAAARQRQLAKRGATVIVGGAISVIAIVFVGILLWRSERAEYRVPRIAMAPKRLAEMRREALQEALGHLLSLRDIMVVATASNGDISGRRLIKRPRLKYVADQVHDSIAWMQSAHREGQRLEFASAKAQADFERFVLWARFLRDSDAAGLGLRDLRRSASELELAMKQASGPLPSVVLPVYELPEPRRHYGDLRYAS